jgi:acyl-CoA synthetase (AMP-forming)/AMP-acid ligase II
VSGAGPLLAATLADAARRFGARPAVVAPAGWAVNYRELDRAVARVAAGLHDRGIRTGDLVALSLPASPDHLVLYGALASLGAVTVGINPRLDAPTRQVTTGHLAPRLLVTTADLDVGVDVDTLLVRPADGPDSLLPTLTADTPAPPVAPEPDRPVAVVLTSGTTGAPKGAVFTDRQLDAIRRIDVGDATEGGGPMLVSTELVHVGIVTKLAWYLRTGATLHLLARWRAADALRVVVTHGIPVIGAISAQVALLLQALDDHDVSGVQALIVGGGPSPAALVREARDRFGAAYSIRYSSTESGGVGTGTAFDAPDEEAFATVGRPRPGVELAIRDDGGAPLPPGEVGTVHLRSGAVMAEWFRDPARTVATIDPNGWLQTDDLGLIDDRGCLRLMGRRSDVYIRGGYNVHPERVEAALLAHPGVADVAVVPRPDPVMGEVGVAVVVPTDPDAPPTLDSLRAATAPHLAHHELPEGIEVVAGLPRNATDKLDRRALRALVTAPRTAS